MSGATGQRPDQRRGTPDRCAVRADLRGDPMIGTAFPAARLLLVEQPGPWGFGGLRESRFPAELAADLEALGNTVGVRVQAIRRPGRTAESTSPRRAWAFADTRDGHRQLHWGEYTEPAEVVEVLSAVRDGATPGEGSGEPVYLICAHGRHDVCCALRGRPVAEALAAVRPGQVWETSHLGGDRFGANVLTLPAGQLYGRVLPFAAADLVQATEAGQVVAPLLRGRIGLLPAAQAALAHLHQGFPGAGQLRVLSVGRFEDGRATVSVATPDGERRVTITAERRQGQGLTCRTDAAATFWTYAADPDVTAVPDSDVTAVPGETAAENPG